MLDACGLAASAGNTVRKLDAVPLTTVVFIMMPEAVAGIVQLPFDPWTVISYSLLAPTGVLRGPTFVPGRVSSRRQGVIGT